MVNRNGKYKSAEALLKCVANPDIAKKNGETKEKIPAEVLEEFDELYLEQLLLGLSWQIQY